MICNLLAYFTYAPKLNGVKQKMGWKTFRENSIYLITVQLMCCDVCALMLDLYAAFPLTLTGVQLITTRMDLRLCLDRRLKYRRLSKKIFQRSVGCTPQIIPTAINLVNVENLFVAVQTNKRPSLYGTLKNSTYSQTRQRLKLWLVYALAGNVPS
ncbi:hypothetical protein OSTOST_08896, partial [Ostertagia ostertagi]